MTDFPITARNRVRRLGQRAAYDRSTIYAIVDAALICHVAFVQVGQPYVIPTLYARQNDCLYLHGSPHSRLLQHIQAGEPVSLAVTLVDGLVLARSVFEHSVNYRSALLFGRGRLLEDPAVKMSALRLITEHILPGRWDDARQPDAKELDLTAVAVIDIESASAKQRQGMPEDFPKDVDLPVWAGILPIKQQFASPQPDEHTGGEKPIPDYIQTLLK
jgi:hypothetical protein